MNICMGSKPKAPEPPKSEPVAAPAQLVDLEIEGEGGGASNFEAELKKKRKQSQTTMAGETGGYGGKTKLG